tara:strand:- start:820 stop:1236 length:417 start_codon:yes stop_codon:yes gene_type:complete
LDNKKSMIIRSAYNTFWCLIGCSIGDFGTIYFFQINDFQTPTLIIMIIAIINGLITSIIFETITLLNQMRLKEAFKTAFGMSFISMLVMEITMNICDWFITGGAYIYWEIIPILLITGFLAAWPYNYWMLKKYNKECH